jgi:hypothetical protein
MNRPELEAFARRAETIYQQRWQAQFERSHPDKFVALEPDSGDAFLGETLSEAINASRQRYPDRLAFGMRVGHRAAVHIGVCTV